ncbi:MAG: fatty acid oxidation complex subunit alpha FadJ [Spirochaetae bacterium HGW-Spirochaetae-1]|jgi:3-hydroxyacyl-CoA dehydrogenase/enoyl-CoA hydratase/3-hydroxybutyryl-CoA epimerase|nr:MAG: fatty acid oxidation complex subunit alpha FadJ [Spirochaetae bacterium HGW-Spirochaetae-1]
MNSTIKKKYIEVKVKDHVAVITVNCPGTKVNAVSSGLLDEITALMPEFENDQEIEGLVIVSGKKDSFIVGADIDELNRKTTREEVIDYISKAHVVLNKLESLSIPVVCAIHGSCLGGGMELTLTARYRIASDSPKTQMGLPEVKLGLIPAGGGTQRLPRLIGIQKALSAMLQGTSFRPKQAKKIGLIDEIVSPYGMEDIAIAKAKDLASGRLKRNMRKRSFMEKILEGNFLGRRIIFSQARKMVMRQTRGHYPAALAIIDSVAYGYRKGMKKGLLKEIQLLGDLVLSPVSGALRSLFFGMTALKKNPLKDKIVAVEKLAVLGAGLMGHGIAAVSTGLADTILLKDMTLDAAARGMKEIWKGLDKRSRSGALTPFERDVQYGKIVPCDDYRNFRNTDLVIEAVFEDITLKRKVLREVEESTGDRTIFASNTSAIPITAIAAEASRRENVVGMHYFSPVPKMPLLEIITTKETAPWVTATVLEFGIRQGKTCIVVKDGPGFYTTRILAPLLFESGLLVYEGAEIPAIDGAMKQFGYPVGPMALLDEVGIDVGTHVTRELAVIFKDRGIAAPYDLGKIVEKGFKGRKSGKGLYRYDVPSKKGKRPVNTEVYALFSGSPRKNFTAEEIQQRVSLMMINEAALCLQEGIIADPRDGDIGAVFGLGFPPFTGGPFRYMDSQGIGSVTARMEQCVEKYGERFRPAQILKDMAVAGKKFYPNN